MPRTEIDLRECTTDMEIIKKQMVWSSACRFWENEISVTRYGQNSVRVVEAKAFKIYHSHQGHHEASDLSCFRQLLNKSSLGKTHNLQNSLCVVES